MTDRYFAHPSSDVSPRATIGDGTQIWQLTQIRELSVIGANCVIGKDVYIDYNARIGNNVKIQNGVSVYNGVTLEDGVFCGPRCCFTNDLRPRAVTPDGVLRTTDKWKLTETLVRTGASICAHATIVCGIEIGRWAMVGAGAVVTRSVPDYGLVYGNPARLRGFVCPCGSRLREDGAEAEDGGVSMSCETCQTNIPIPQEVYAAMVDDRSSPVEFEALPR